MYFWDIGTEKIEQEIRPDGSAVEAPLRNASVVVQGSGAQGQRGGSRAVRFSPRLCVLAVGGDELVSCCLQLAGIVADFQSFWLPGGDEDKVEEGY